MGHVKTDKLTQTPLTFYSLTFNLFNDCLGRIKPVLKYKGKENLHKLTQMSVNTNRHTDTYQVHRAESLRS